MKCKRGGHTLKTSKIGKVNCLRQQIMMPGERMNLSMEGKIRLESLRERDVMRINAHLATFMTPLRWLVPEWPDYVKEGPGTQIVLPKTGGWVHFDELGIGASYSAGVGTQVLTFWIDAYLRVVNEWYKWPESIDFSVDQLKDKGGVSAVPLAKTWSRTRQNIDPDPNLVTVDAADSFDVRNLAEIQAKFRSSMKRDVLSFGRWMELVKDTWNGDGSREVDQVPIMLDQTSIGVNPREIPATDGASLGQWQSLFDFSIDHQIKGIIAPEHCIITTMLVLRFSGTLESVHPLHTDFSWDWETMVADPEFIASQSPQEVVASDLFPTPVFNSLGYLPAGWQWRCDTDVIGRHIDIRDSFPYSLQPETFGQAKNAQRVKDAFRSQALEDYMVDVNFTEDCNQPIGDSMDSYFSGMADDAQVGPGGKGQEFPKGGKML